MYEMNPSLDGATNLQDILMSESFFDDFATTNNLNNNPNTTQPPSTTLSEFEAQIQAMLDANNNDLGNSGQNQQNSSIQDFNNYQYDVLSDDPLFGSPDSFLNSQNSYNTFDDNCSLSTPSPPQFNNLQDFMGSSNDAMIQDSGRHSSMEESLFDKLLTSKKDLDTINLMISQQVDNAKKRNSPFDRDSISPDRSLKKKRDGGISKSLKKSSSGSPKITLGKQFIKDEPTSISDILKQLVKDDQTSSVPSILCNDGTAQSIVVPSSPVVPSSNYVTNALLAFNQGAWNQTINPSATNFIPDGIMDVSSQFTNMPLLGRDGSSPTAKLPINRLKPTVTNTQSQQNFQQQPNKQQKKVAHNAIERRYRNNINDRINDLKNVVPALCHLKSKDDDDVDEVDGIPAATKLNKATILRKATEYINYLKSNNQKVKRENETLRKLIEALPGGVEIYNAYMTEQPDEIEDPLNLTGHFTPPPSSEGSPGSSPEHQYDDDPNAPPTPPGNTGSRALMALFMCMTFFTSQSSYVTQSHPADHHHEGRVLTNTPTPVVESNSLNVNDGTITIDLWYLIRILTFLMCLTYILRPSLFSSQQRRLHKSNSIVASVLNAKTKNAKTLYQSLSNLSNGLPVNIFETIIGLTSEFIKFSLRRFLGWDIASGSTLIDYEGRLLEVALWGKMGEAELCGGNNKVSRLLILYTCLRTVNLLESPYTTRKCIYLSSSRIYANAALQSHIGLSSFPFLARRAVAHFWKLANIEKVRESGIEEKWLQIALNSDHQSEMWKDVANRISDYVLKKTNEEQSNIESMKNITIPLMLVTDVQAMIYLKQAFYRLIPIKCGGKKESYLKNKRSFSFLELVRNTTPNSFTHWYALVGCCIEAFSLGHSVLGENFVNRLRAYPTIISDENNYDKQIVAMGLLSYALLMHGKLEASVRCANKASIALTKRKEQRNSDDGRKIEFSDELNDYSSEIEQEVHYLTEFCVGWIVLEVKILGWKIVEGLISASNNSTKSSADKDENTSTTESPSDTTDTSTTTTKFTTTNKLPNQLPNILNCERLQNAIILWTRYLRRLSKNSVFEDIKKIREIFINKLVTLERIVGGDHDYSEYDLYSYEVEDEENNNRQQSSNNNSHSLSESENRANKAWKILKGM